MEDFEYEYEPPPIVTSFHNTPRFGHPSDVGILFNGEATPNVYAMGLIFIPVVLCTIFLIWNLMLIVFKCCFGNQILGGAHPSPGSKWTSCYRTGIFISCIFIMTLGSISLRRSTVSLQNSFTVIRSYIDELQALVYDVSDAAELAVEAQTSFEDVRIITLSLLKDGICQDNTIITSIDNEISQVATVLRDMGDWSSVFEGALVDVQNTLQQAENVVSKEIIEVVDVVEGYMTISWIMIVMLIFASLLLIGELVAWCKPRSYRLSGLFCVLSWVILPLFMFSLALSVFLACLCGFILVFNSDTCIGSSTGNPEGLFKEMVNYDRLEFEYQNLLDYYIVNGCEGSAGLIDVVQDQLNNTISYHYLLKSAMEQMVTPDNLEELENICGISLDETVSSIQNFTEVTEALIPLAHHAQDTIYCPTVNHLYRGLSHDFLCTRIPITIGWIFWSVVFYTFFGMFLFTFRGALFPSVDQNEFMMEESSFGGITGTTGMVTGCTYETNEEREIIYALNDDGNRKGNRKRRDQTNRRRKRGQRRPQAGRNGYDSRLQRTFTSDSSSP